MHWLNYNLTNEDGPYEEKQIKLIWVQMTPTFITQLKGALVS